MTIKQIKIDDIKPYENNPRHNENAVDKVAASIKEFGFKVPIVIDKNNVIVAGHTRLKAAQNLELTEAPCIVADDLTDDQIKAFRLADNKTGEFAEWDFEKLDAELAELANKIDMTAFGFDVASDDDDDGNTDDGDTVLDCFGGSGSTLIACQETNRKCRMIELSERYCDVIIKRWETLTGEKAEKIKG